MKNSLLMKNGAVIRILDVNVEDALIIDCVRLTMPVWVKKELLAGYTEITIDVLEEITGIHIQDMDGLSRDENKFIHKHFTLIAGVLPFIGDINMRSSVIGQISKTQGVSKQTIRRYLCLYLAYQDMSVFAPKERLTAKELSADEKNMRWALNKFYYTTRKHSLKVAYTQMLKEKYCDGNGVLTTEYPSFYQFRYFYRKHKKLQNYYISRNGIKDYQKNHRPLLGDNVQAFTSHVGVGMLDATVCDIYLVNESGNLVGRPILTACIDGFSSLCCGYMLSWEGGVYSLRGMMLNIISNKKEWCYSHGIEIKDATWDCNELPATLVTDMGSEYISENFEQITELGVSLVNLASYRPELKGSVEKFFDLIQESFKPYLKGKGVIEADFQERGAHDYRKDACLTMEQFEKIILHCILYYNNERVIENYPYTKDMLECKVSPYAADIWNYGKRQRSADLITVSKEDLILTLLPRTTARFTRNGLKVNGLRYKNKNYTEKYLSGGNAVAVYDPDDVSYVWLIDNGAFVLFELIESRFLACSLNTVTDLKEQKKQIVKEQKEDNLQAKISLSKHIETIANQSVKKKDTAVKEIRKTRKAEQEKKRIDYMKEVKRNV